MQDAFKKRTGKLEVSSKNFSKQIRMDVEYHGSYSRKSKGVFSQLECGHWSGCSKFARTLSYDYALQKQAYSNILENLPAKYEKNSDKKNLIFFLCLLKNIDCGYSLEPPRRGGSNEYPQSMF